MDKKRIIKTGTALSGSFIALAIGVISANAARNANKEISPAEVKDAISAGAKTTYSTSVEVGPKYAMNGYSITEKDTYAIAEENQAEETEKDASVSDSISAILDRIDESLTETNSEINEIEYTQKTPDEWVDMAVLNAQNVLLSAAENDPEFNLLINDFDTKEEVKALLDDAIANPNNNSIANYIIQLNNPQFATDMNYWLRAYTVFSNAKQNIDDLNAGDNKPSEDNPAPKDDFIVPTPANSENSQAKTYSIIASLAAVAAIAAGAAALIAKRGLSRGRGMRIAGTRLATGNKKTWSARRLSRVANRIVKKATNAKALKQKALNRKNDTIKRLDTFRANYRLGNNKYLNSPSININKKRLNALEKKVYAITTAGQKITNEQKMQFLRTYSRRAVWSANKFFSANKQYFADNTLGLNQKNYLNLMRGLNRYARSSLSERTSRATCLSNQSVNLLKAVEFPNDSRYYGKNNQIFVNGVDGIIPLFPERFVSLAELENKKLKKNIEMYFDEVSTMYPALEKETHYLTVTFVNGQGENEKSHTISAGFDNAEAMKYIEANIIRALPTVTQKDDKSIEIVSRVTITRAAHCTRSTTKTTSTNYSTDLELESLLTAQNLYLNTAQKFIKKPSVAETFINRLIDDSTNTPAPAASTSSSLSHEIEVAPSELSKPPHDSSIGGGKAME